MDLYSNIHEYLVSIKQSNHEGKIIDAIQKQIIEEVADLHEIPEGAYNIRANGKSAARNTTANIDIVKDA